MNTLRQLLKTEEFSLFDALEKAQFVLENEFFPAISNEGESYNTNPHVSNLERYLNDVIRPEPDLFNKNSSIYLSTYELYSILMAILFHDIGRKKSDRGHGTFTRKYLEDNYVRFCIPSQELASAIGQICEYHKSYNEKDISDLSTTILDSNKGYIRIRELAELLVLLDEMDNTYMRIPPLYVLGQPGYSEYKSIFRSSIKGVAYNSFVKAIIVSLDENLLNNPSPGPDSINKSFKFDPDPEKPDDSQGAISEYSLFKKIEMFNDKSLIDQIITGKIRPSVNIDDLNNDANIKRLLHKFLRDSVKKNSESYRKLYHILAAELDKNELSVDDKNNYKEAKKSIKKVLFSKKPPEIILAIIIRSIRESYLEKTYKFTYLSRLGIYINSWLIYFREHLYNYNGDETFEPVFNKDYLINVAKCMWNLSTQVFGKSYFTFNDLASAALESNIDKIKLAVNRIDILSRKFLKNKKLVSAISFDNNGWRWENKIKSGKCDFIDFSEIKEIIDQKIGLPIPEKSQI